MSVRQFIPRRRFRSGALIAAALAATASARGQLATLDKGHQLLLNDGLQIWGTNTDSYNSQLNYPNYNDANFSGVMWSHGQSRTDGTLPAGEKWSKWVDYTASPSTAMNASETARQADMLAVQVGDEQQGDIESATSQTTAWFQAARAGNYFQNQLLYVNSFFINNDATYANFIAQANPDAISWDGYPFTNPGGQYITPQNWLVNANHFRRHALGSYIGATGNAARPYGMYVQTFHDSLAIDPGEVQVRWQQFTAWTLGYTFIDGFTAGGGNTSLFYQGNQNLPMDPNTDPSHTTIPASSTWTYTYFKEASRQSRNLGPALTRLISYGYGPSIAVGKNPSGVTNVVPGDWLPFNQTNAPAAQQFLTGVSATNPGTKNGGQPGDVYVGFFNPLHTSLGDPAGTTYFMVTNSLGAYLDDPTLTAADCTQNISLNFDSQYGGVSTLLRLRRTDGQIEIVPLTRTTARQYLLQFSLEGGTGDLFKYNDGTPFVGVNNTMYWDNNPGANNTATGAGLGGAGTWEGATQWYSGAPNGAWTANRDAIFWGSGGAVTLSGAQAVNSLAFKSNGYSLGGGTLNMAGQFISTYTGVTTTISSTLAGTGGFVKSGAGTLVLTNAANAITGGAAVTGGTLQISADGAMGPAPTSFTAANIVLNGGALRFGASLPINNFRGIDIGPGGGTIDTQGFDNGSTGYNATAGGFRGPGDLTKVGSGTFFAAATTGGANTSWKGSLILKQGTWKIVASDGLPYNALVADGLQAGQVTLDGGTWQMGATASITNVRRGITIAAGGGTIDTQGQNLTWAGPLLGSVSSATLTKTGTGLLRFTQGAGTPSPYASTFPGSFNINAGTVELDNGTAMGDLASINIGSASLQVLGNETVGSVAGANGSGNIGLGNSMTLTAGGNNNSTTFVGFISGAGGIAKIGSGRWILTGANNYTGATTVSAGTLQLGPQARFTVLSSGGANITGGRLVFDYNGGINPATQVEQILTSDYSTNFASGQIRSANATAQRGLGWFDDTANAQVHVAPALYGDADLSGSVDLTDFTFLAANFNKQSGSVWRDGDFNYDDKVDLTDFTLLAGNFNQSLPAASADLGATVPEPSTIVMLPITSVVLAARRRLRNKKPRTTVRG